MAEAKQDNSIIITNCRLSYFYGFHPYTGEDGKQSYSAHAIIDTNHQQLPALQALIRKVASETFKGEADQILQQLKAQDRLCIHRGDISKPGQEAYKGKLFISASNKVKPRIVATINGVNQEVDEDHQFAPYSGCRANVIVNIWGQNNKWGKRINAGLLGVQFLKHDERLSSGRVASVDEFGLAPVDADGAAPPTDSGGDGLI